MRSLWFWSINIIALHCMWKKVLENIIIENQWKTCNSYVKRKIIWAPTDCSSKERKRKNNNPWECELSVHKCGANKPRVVEHYEKITAKNTKKEEQSDWRNDSECVLLDGLNLRKIYIFSNTTIANNTTTDVAVFVEQLEAHTSACCSSPANTGLCT